MIKIVIAYFSRVAATIAVALLVLAPKAMAEENYQFLLGLIPEENIFDMVEKHQPLAIYLSEKLDVNVRFTILSRYGDVVDRFTAREMDGAFFGIFTAALAMDKLGVKPIAMPVPADGDKAARGAIIARKDSAIKFSEDLRGKRAAFVDRATATGYIYAIAYLRHHGVQDVEEFLDGYFFTGSHASTIYAVLDGRADFGAVKFSVLDNFMQKDPMIAEEIHIMDQSVDLPQNTLFISSSIDDELAESLKALLLGLDKDARGAEILGTLGYRKFVEAKDSDFDVVRDLARKAGINIKEYLYR